jgi:tetratricopeptide (TPR) repeat protein
MRVLRIAEKSVGLKELRSFTLTFVADNNTMSATCKIGQTLTIADRASLRWYLEDFPRYPFPPAPRIAKDVESRLKAWGEDLFEKVFTQNERARALWREVSRKLSNTRFEISAFDTHPEILWELMWAPGQPQPVELQVNSFVRKPILPNRLRESAPADQVRILVVVSRPAGRLDVPLRSVAGHLIRALSSNTALDLTVLRPPTFAQMTRVLQDAQMQSRPYHVVHFDGHGAYNSRRFGDPYRGYLIFEAEDEPGGYQPIDGATIGSVLAQAEVNLLLMNACRSAHVGIAATPEEARETTDSLERAGGTISAYGSLAHEVAGHGVLGVLAMQYNIWVPTAATFVATVYSALAQGSTFGEAATRARKELADNPERRFMSRHLDLQDWLVPVVYEAAPISIVCYKGLAVPGGRPAMTRGVPRRVREGRFSTKLDQTFVGRDESILELDRAFDGSDVVLLSGSAGSGKTATATEFASWYRETGGLANGATPVILFTSLQPELSCQQIVDRAAKDILEAQGQDCGSWSESPANERRRAFNALVTSVSILWIWDQLDAVYNNPPSSAQASWDGSELRDLGNLLRDLDRTGAKVLVTSRSNKHPWIGQSLARVRLSPMSEYDCLELIQVVAASHDRRIDEAGDWRPIIEFASGNPLALVVLVSQALREEMLTRAAIIEFVTRLMAGFESGLQADSAVSESTAAFLAIGYSFRHAFSSAENRQLALLYLFQGFVDSRVLTSVHRGLLGELSEDYGDGTEIVRLLERAARAGLLALRGTGLYSIHPALAIHLRSMFVAAYGDLSDIRVASVVRNAASAVATRAEDCWRSYKDGNLAIVGSLRMEESNLLYYRRLSRENGWWTQVIQIMNGIWTLYEHTERLAEWSTLVDEIAVDVVDSMSGGPKLGLERAWDWVTRYRVNIAIRSRRYDFAASLLASLAEYASGRVGPMLEWVPNLRLNAESESGEWLATLAEAKTLLGQVLIAQEAPERFRVLEEALSLWAVLDDAQGQANAAFELGNGFMAASARDLDRASYWYQRGLELVDTRDPLRQKLFYVQLGQVASYRLEDLLENSSRSGDSETFKSDAFGYLQAALGAYFRVLDLTPSDDLAGLGMIHRELGNLGLRGTRGLRAMGLIDSAVSHYQMATDCFDRAGDRQSAGITRHNMALMLAEEGRLAEALKWAETALLDFQAVDDSRFAAEADSMIGRIKEAMSL